MKTGFKNDTKGPKIPYRNYRGSLTPSKQNLATIEDLDSIPTSKKAKHSCHV